MTTTPNARPLGDLLGGLVSDITGLFRMEIDLAKVEASERLDDVMRAGRSLAIGLALAIGAIGVFLAALVSGGTALLVFWGIQEVWANFVAAVVVTVVVGGIAWALLAAGSSQLKASKLNMQRTAHSLRADAEAVKENL